MSERESNRSRPRPAVSCGLVVLTALLSAVLLLTMAWPAGGTGLLGVVEQQTDIPVQLPDDLVMSDDGRNVYLVGESAVTVLTRDPATGLTAFLEAHLEGLDGVTGLRLANSLVLPGDGRFAYVASPLHAGADGVDRGAVAIFERDPSDGSLHLVDVHTEGFEGEAGRFETAHAVASPNGSQLYVASSPDQAVLVFERDPSDGSLQFLDAARFGFDGVAGSVFVAFDPEGRHLYLTNLYRGSVTVFRRNRTTGILRFVEDLMSEDPYDDMTFPVFPASLVVSPDGHFAYVTNFSAFPFDAEGGSIVSFRRDRSTGALTLQRLEDILATPRHMIMTADGSYLYAPGWGGYISGPSGVWIYRRDATSGALEWIDVVTENSAFSDDAAGRTWAVAISGDGRHLYAGNFDRQPVAAFERSVDGRLTVITDPTAPADGRGRLLGAERAAVSPDGRHVYVASPASDSLAVFERKDDGSLDFVELLTEVSGTKAVAVAPDGRWVYAFDSVFARDAASGRLERVEQGDSWYHDFSAEDFAVTPDGRHIYVANTAFGDQPVRAYAQAPATGQLEQVRIAIGPVPGFGEAKWSRSVAVGPDGAFVYAAGVFDRSPTSDDDVAAVWVFARDRATGSLVLDTFATLDSSDSRFDPPSRLALSPDGRHLYLARPGENELRVYEHRRRGGRLVLVETHGDGVAGVEGMAEPRDVAVTASGHLVYVAGRRSDAVAVFARDPESGRLTFLEVGAQGLFRVDGLAASPDNRHVYAVSSRLSSVTALTLDCPDAEDVLCVVGNRFRLDVEWRTAAGGTGTGRTVPVSSDNSGLFWFFDADNWEMLVKVLDGCSVNDRFWVFAAATTDVEYTLRVTDTRTGAQRRYFNPLGTASAAITDTSAFAGCPDSP